MIVHGNLQILFKASQDKNSPRSTHRSSSRTVPTAAAVKRQANAATGPCRQTELLLFCQPCCLLFFVRFLPHSHSLFDVGWCDRVGKVDHEFGELLHVYYVAVVLALSLNYLRATSHLQSNHLCPSIAQDDSLWLRKSHSKSDLYEWEGRGTAPSLRKVRKSKFPWRSLQDGVF